MAAGARHADETACSLQYGRRLGRVQVAPSARAAEAVGGAAEGDVRRALAAVSGELEAMLAKGQGGRFGGSATPSEMRTFNANVARLERERRAAERLRTELTEARAGAPGAPADRLTAQLAEAEAEAANLRDIVLRQKSIKGFWIEPTPGYKAKEAQFNELVSRGQLLGLG